MRAGVVRVRARCGRGRAGGWAWVGACGLGAWVAKHDSHWNVRIPAAFAAVGPEGSRMEPLAAAVSAAVAAARRAAGRQFVGDMVTVRTLLVA